MSCVFKIYGMERSGTNYLAALLSKNFDVNVLSNITGWKHGVPVYPPSFDPETWFLGPLDKKALIARVTAEKIINIRTAYESDKYFYVIIVRNPLGWVKSFQEFRYRKQKKVFSLGVLNNFYLLILEKQKKIFDKKVNFYGRVPDIRQCVNSWNVMMREYVRFYERHKEITMIIKYEDLLNNLNSQLDIVSSKFKLENKAGMYCNIFEPLDASNTDFNELKVKTIRKENGFDIRVDSAEVEKYADKDIISYFNYGC